MAAHLRSVPGGGPAPERQRRSAGDWSILMARAQVGDRDAYRELLAELLPLVRAMVMQRVRNRADADDVVQDILMTVHQVRHTYDTGRPFLPWLTTIARRRIIDRLRRHGRTAGREVDISGIAETFVGDTANRDEQDWSPRALRDAIDQLPEGQRQAVTMLKLQEMSLKEAALATGASVTALKVAVHRAIRNLRGKLRGNP